MMALDTTGYNPKRRRTEELSHLNDVPHSFENLPSSLDPELTEIEQKIKEIVGRPEYLPQHQSQLQEVLIKAKYETPSLGQFLVHPRPA